MGCPELQEMCGHCNQEQAKPQLSVQHETLQLERRKEREEKGREEEGSLKEGGKEEEGREWERKKGKGREEEGKERKGKGKGRRKCTAGQGRTHSARIYCRRTASDSRPMDIQGHLSRKPK